MTTHDDLLHAAALAQAEHPGELEYLFAEKMLAAVEPIIRADERESILRFVPAWREEFEAEVRESIADLVQMKFSMTSARSHDSGCVCHLCAVNSTVDAAVDFIRGGECAAIARGEQP